MVLLSWSAFVKSLFLFVKSLLFLFTSAQSCINFATVKIVLFCIVLYIGLCVSIKVIKKKKKSLLWAILPFRLNFEILI